MDTAPMSPEEKNSAEEVPAAPLTVPATFTVPILPLAAAVSAELAPTPPLTLPPIDTLPMEPLAKISAL